MSFLEKLEILLEKDSDSLREKHREPKTKAKKEKKEKNEKRFSLRERREQIINPMISDEKALKLASMGVNTELIRAIYFLIFRKVSRKKAEETLDEIINYLQDIRKNLVTK